MKTRSNPSAWNHDTYLYLAPRGAGIDQQTQSVLWENVVGPSIDRRRLEIEAALAAEQSSQGSSQGASPRSSDHLAALITFDGCGNNMPFIMSALAKMKHGQKDRQVKLDSQQTHNRQPADKGSQFAEGHAFELIGKPSPPYMAGMFRNLLKPDEPKIAMVNILSQFHSERRPYVERYLANSSDLQQHAYDKRFTKRGWKLSGLDPLSEETMLSFWPYWNNKPSAFRNRIRSYFPALRQVVRDNGRIPLQEFETRDIPRLAEADMKTRKRNLTGSIDTRPLNQDYCVIVNHPSIVGREDERSTSAAEKKAQKAARAAVKAVASATSSVSSSSVAPMSAPVPSASPRPTTFIGKALRKGTKCLAAGFGCGWTFIPGGKHAADAPCERCVYCGAPFCLGHTSLRGGHENSCKKPQKANN
jgi:hypothetical protein